MKTALVLAVWLASAAGRGRGRERERTGARAPHRDVVTTQGAARGYLAPRPPHYAFLGLPYARPHPHTDRFKAPSPPARWDGVFEAAHRVRCGRRRAHACQVLNVFAPHDARARPVLVHVHDGDFDTGWGSHEPPSRLLTQGFVVVTINYRLGADGFLCLGTPDIPGNAGLKDQVAALYWVHRNIDKFGGDPYAVTLYGTGSGAASVEFLLLSGATEGLAQRIILESGSVLSPTSLGYNSFAKALNVAISLGYQDAEMGTPDDLNNFFQELPENSLDNVTHSFMPCVESGSDSFILDKDPLQLLHNGSFAHVPLLITYSKEIINESTLNKEAAKFFHTLPEHFEELLPNNLVFDTDELKIKISEQMKDLYFGDHILGGDVAECYENYMNDVFTVYPIVKSATMHAAASQLPVYLMEFSHQDGNKTIYDYIFGKKPLNNEDELVAQKLVSLWINFMKYSDPTPLSTSILPIVWQPVTFAVRNNKADVSTADCLTFNSDSGVSMGRPSTGHTLVIWDHLYDKFYKFHTPVKDLK